MNIRRRAKRLRRERLIARGELPKEALDAPLSDEEVNADAEQQAKNEDKVGKRKIFFLEERK